MLKHIINIHIFCAVLFSMPVLAEQPAQSEYLDGGHSKIALILAHGRGKHPGWKVVDPLRKGIHAKLGFHTLSLQMPNEDKNWKEYADDFPTAYRTIKDGIRFLKEEKGVNIVFLMGHSMGGRMTSAFLSANPGQTVDGLIIVGCRNNGGYPLACIRNLEDVDIPVLDIWGGADINDNTDAAERKKFLSGRYQQVEITGANHKLDGYEEELVTNVANWLMTQEAVRLAAPLNNTPRQDRIR